MSYKLYTYTPSYRAWKILIAAAYNGINIEIPAFTMMVDNKTPEFLKKNPLGKVPVLDTPQGPIFESNAIARYVARLRNDTELYGSNFFESSQVDQWLDAVTNELEPALLIAYYRSSQTVPVDDAQYEEVLKDINKFLTVLDNYLLTRTYLVGNHITLADIVTTCALVEVVRRILNNSFANDFINLNRWYQTCINQPEFARVIGSADGGEQKQQQQQQQQQQQHGKQNKQDKQEKHDKQDKGGKKEKQEKQEKPAKQEKAKEKPKEDDAEEEEESFEDKPKGKNPLDLLPKSSMNLDSVKKLFFEKRPNFEQFFPEFWKMFDAQGYSLYTLDYNYNEDNKVCYMTCNLTAGYVQRLEDLRKYAFGSLNVTGKDEDHGPFKINGAFIFRGPEVPAEMRDCPDTEYYTLKAIDSSNADDRKRFQELFIAQTIDGESVLDRKYFK